MQLPAQATSEAPLIIPVHQPSSLDSQHFQAQLVKTAIQYTGSPPSAFFTVYAMRIDCPASNTAWFVKLRYSSLADVRKKLLKMIESIPRHLEAERTTITEFIMPLESFPKKRMFKYSPAVLEDRKHGMVQFVQGMLQVRQKCMCWTDSSNAPIADIIHSLLEIIELTLEIPLKFMAHNWKARHMEKLTRVSPTNNYKECEACSICWSEFKCDEDETAIVQIPCQHVFHSSCILEWLGRQRTCPICRADI